jgi:hypothetical protein
MAALSKVEINETREYKVQVRCWWLTLVILATWEAEMGKTTVQCQPRQIVLEIPSPK